MPMVKLPVGHVLKYSSHTGLTVMSRLVMKAYATPEAQYFIVDYVFMHA